MSEALKRCPFCGDANIKLRPSGLGHSHYIECVGCDARGGLSPTVESAVADWNRVADAPSAGHGTQPQVDHGAALAEIIAEMCGKSPRSYAVTNLAAAINAVIADLRASR